MKLHERQKATYYDVRLERLRVLIEYLIKNRKSIKKQLEYNLSDPESNLPINVCGLLPIEVRKGINGGVLGSLDYPFMAAINENRLPTVAEITDEVLMEVVL